MATSGERLQVVSRRRAAGKPAGVARLFLFARNFFKFPAMLGSIIPSSPYLVNDVLGKVDWERAQVIVEFGPGVGTMTQEVLKRMRPDAVLIALELNRQFVEFLREEFPDARLRIVHASAAKIRSVLEDLGLRHADYIISGIPYTNMPEALRLEILRESRQALGSEGSLLIYQFTRTVLPYLQSNFRSVRQGFQPLNIFPARIFHCTP